MESGTPRVEIRLLGPVQLVRDGSDVAVGGPRQRRLLALLALRAERGVPADELVEELWADEPSAAAETTLRTYISRLRRSLDQAATIDRTDRGYVLNVPPEATDALRFEQLVRDGDAALARRAARQARDAYERALSLWRGRPFGELGDEGSLRIAANRLEEMRLGVLERRLEADLASGRAAELVDELEGLVLQHPFRERLWHHLMLALYRAGRQADALAAYHRARTQLDEHLGLEPGEELRSLEGAILRQDVPPAAAQEERPALPAPMSSFVGRDRELREIADRIAGARLVTLTGVGGVGKTRLAVEVAARIADRFADGVAFADFAPIGDPALVGGQVAIAVGVREGTDADIGDLLVAHLRERELLLVLDNCEHVRERTAALVERLLLAGPGLRVLATSRVPLGLTGETDAPVAPLELSRVSSASPGDGADPAPDAVALFLARARATRPALGIDAATLSTAARICADLEGLPLAIELAAARAKTLSLEEIAERLNDRFRFLVSWRRLTTARHRTLREAMDWSYELLDSDEQALLMRLSVFAGGFDLSAVATVCLDGDDDRALELVDSLVQASLLIVEDGLGGTRYRLLETVRQYAAEQLRSSGAEQELRREHAAWGLALAEAAAAELSGQHQKTWLDRLEAEHNNLRACLAFLAESGDWEAHIRLAIAMTRFWYVRGHLVEGRTRLATSLDANPGGDPLLRRRALTAAASLALLQGDYEAATALAEESLDVARGTGEARLVANGLSNLGAIVLAGGQVDRAGPLLEEAVTVARASGDRRILALAVNNLGDLELTRRDYKRARPLFEESLALLRERGDTANVARALFNLGASELQVGRHDVAERHFRDGLALAHDAGDREDLAWLLEGMAALAGARGDGRRAGMLLGAAGLLLSAMGAAYKPFERSMRDATEAAATDLIGSAELADAVAHGAALSLADAIRLALEETP